MDNDDTLHYSSDLVIILNMTIELRDYQEQLVNEVITILNKHNNGFLESPTGSGKSAMMLTIAMRFKPTQSKKVAVVCHQENLYKQTSERIKKYFNIDLKESVDDQITVKVENTTFVFMTWQKLKNIINKEYYDLLIVDEAHWGSSIPFGQQQTKEHKSFLKIFRSKNIGARLYVSATLLRLDQDVYKGLLDEKGNPQRKYLANLALSKAASLGIISDINIIPISTTDTLKLKNLSTGKEEMLEREDVETLAPDVKQKEANIKAEISKKALEEGALNSVLEVIAQREWKNGDIQSIDHIPPLLVFANGVNSDSPLSVKNVIDGFKKKAREVFKDKISLNKYFIFLAHSGNLPGNAKSSQVIDDFSKGKIKILVVSDMCREGFDYPELKAILDLVPSRNNVRCFLQTLGRVMRPSLNKEVKRYYYPDTLQCRLKAKNGVTSELSSETQSSLVEGIKSVQAEKSFSEEDVNTFVEMTKDGLSKICEAQAVQQHEEDAAYATGVESLQKYISIDPEVKEAYTVDLPFVITDSYTRDVNRLLINLQGDRLFDILQTMHGSHDPEGKEQELIEWAKTGKDKPSCRSDDPRERSLYGFLTNSLNSTGPEYRETFSKIISNTRPDWVEDIVLLKKTRLENDWYKNGTHPHKGQRLYYAHLKYHSKLDRMYQNKWSTEMQSQYPKAFRTISELSFERMLSIMPSNVRFKEGQLWKGTKHKYIFIDSTYGEFNRTPSELMYKCWKRGLSGHPMAARARSGEATKTPIRCVETNKIFVSIHDASRQLSLQPANINAVLRGRRKTAGGYTFVYEKSVRNRKRK